MSTGAIKIRKIVDMNAVQERREEGFALSLRVRKYKTYEKTYDHAEDQELAMRMSLNAGTDLFEPNVKTERLHETLRRQADLGSAQLRGELAIDQPENAANYKLWVELLQYRQRVDGFRGVFEVWKGLMGRELDLPVRGTEADILWGTFIDASIGSEGFKYQLLRRIGEYAEGLYERSGTQYPGLHGRVVGRLLRIIPSRAQNFHDRFVQNFGTTYIDLSTLAEDCANSQNLAKARNAFTRIYLSLKPGPMYDAFMAEMLKCEDDSNVRSWHRFFVRHGDIPSLEVIAVPEIQRLLDVDAGALPAKLRKRITKSAAGRSKQDILPYLPLSRAKMSTIVGDVHGIKQKELGDSFVAKMFATQAFPLDMVIKGLEFFGIQKLGPLAIREMALKAGNFVEFANKLSVVKAKGISLDTSVYGQLVQKLATEGSVQLFDTLIQSDQHPESYEDTATQELLLEIFLKKQDWLKAHITLMGLSLTSENAHSGAWNHLFQGYIKNQDYQAVARTAQQMQALNMKFTGTTLTFLHKYLLPTRRRGQAPFIASAEAQSLDPLQFTTNIYIHAAKSGVVVDPLLWKENLKRFGMTHRWGDVEQLVLWLVDNYNARSQPRPYEAEERWMEPPGMLQSIFGKQMRQALVTWAFRRAWHGWDEKSTAMSAPGNGHPSSICEPWAKGLWLLRRMGEYGLPTTPETARNAFLMRMWILFGPSASKEGLNEKVRLHSTSTLAHFVKHANEVWNGELFDLEPRLLENTPQSHAELMIAIFGRRRRVYQHKRLWADVGSFAAVGASHGRTTQSRRRHRLAERLALRRNNPFLLERSTSLKTKSTTV
jgi:hypothetical protein